MNSIENDENYIDGCPEGENNLNSWTDDSELPISNSLKFNNLKLDSTNYSFEMSEELATTTFSIESTQTAYQLSWLPAVLGKAGLKVALVDGWLTRGRGPMAQKIEGVICHHTAGPRNGNMPSLGILKDGRTDLPGPLSQLGLGRDGTYYVIAAGKSNHGGMGSWQGFSGNDKFIGIEAENTGDSIEPWSPVQYEAYVKGIAAILNYLDLPTIMCCGHKEYAPNRKIDPTFNMDEFREQVNSLR
ncbi:N-acetylmuramoyl-L-alanine amidase [Acinetobacter oleivorans]|uniref:N-acetylmuramoyl-L-alanine amidase n=1 Tax=Acinetobacter oleivorans TaxID=1148157 RepID=UPI00226D3F60|nr:N-acetylmuramoyl-L-alanine amidase [Acinetobacter oleivorans]